MEENAKKLRKQAADCIRQFLSGHVSCDHLIEEFRSADDRDIREIIQLVEEATAGIDRYQRLERREPGFREKMEKLIHRLENH